MGWITLLLLNSPIHQVAVLVYLTYHVDGFWEVTAELSVLGIACGLALRFAQGRAARSGKTWA